MGMGYQGYVRVFGNGSAGEQGPGMLVLATGASVNMVLEPIFSTAVWGAGWYNAAETAHYADSALRYEGSVEIELQMGEGGNFWNFIHDFVVTHRAFPKSFEISPDGSHVYKYHATQPYNATYDTKGAWCSTANISTSESSFVTCSLGIVAITRDESDPLGAQKYSDFQYKDQKYGVIGAKCSDLSASNPLNPGGRSVDPIPFWRTNAQILTGTYSTPFDGGALPQEGLETVDWGVDITNNETVLYTCSGDRLPRAVLMGPMSVTGNVTLYHPAGVFDPITGPNGTGTLTDPYSKAENTWFRASINYTDSSDVAKTAYIEIPAAVIDSDDYGIQGGDSVTNRAFGMKGMGGRCASATGDTNVLPPCVISDADGALPAAT